MQMHLVILADFMAMFDKPEPAKDEWSEVQSNDEWIGSEGSQKNWLYMGKW